MRWIVMLTIFGITVCGFLSGCTSSSPKSDDSLAESKSAAAAEKWPENEHDDKITIRLEAEDTKNLSGVYYHEAELTDTTENVSTITTGHVNIKTDGI